MRQHGLVLVGTLVLAMAASAAQGQTRVGFDTSVRLLMHRAPRFMLGVCDSGGSDSTDPALWEQQIFSPTGSRGSRAFPLKLYLNDWLGSTCSTTTG